MNVTAFTSLINEPNIISEAQTVAGKVIDEFPFSKCRALRLKGYTTKIVSSIILL
jgi:hypothetical protein